jgi:hypothetical protein
MLYVITKQDVFQKPKMFDTNVSEGCNPLFGESAYTESGMGTRCLNVKFAVHISNCEQLTSKMPKTRPRLRSSPYSFSSRS